MGRFVLEFIATYKTEKSSDTKLYPRHTIANNNPTVWIVTTLVTNLLRWSVLILVRPIPRNAWKNEAVGVETGRRWGDWGRKSIDKELIRRKWKEIEWRASKMLTI